MGRGGKVLRPWGWGLVSGGKGWVWRGREGKRTVSETVRPVRGGGWVSEIVVLEGIMKAAM